MITISADLALAELNGIMARLANPQPVLKSIGDWQAWKVRNRIQETKTDPDGKAWAEWAPFTLEERTEKGNAHQGLLWDTGHLLDSINVESFMDGLNIGTDVDYAEELQNGRSDKPKMPARPFIGWSTDDFIHMENKMAVYLETGA